MNLIQLAKKHLEDALTKGVIEMPDTQEYKELKTSEILSIAKFVYKEGISTGEETIAEDKSNMPSEMFEIKEKAKSKSTLSPTLLPTLNSTDTYDLNLFNFEDEEEDV